MNPHTVQAETIIAAARHMEYIHPYISLMEGAMLETRVAKLFMNGASQAVRLPAEFRFEGSEVYATRDPDTGDVVLSTRPGARAWADFFDFMRTVDVPDDFMAERPMNVPPQERDVFGENK
jgi:antitoxin VapB